MVSKAHKLPALMKSTFLWKQNKGINFIVYKDPSLLGSFNGPEPGGYGVYDKKVKERKRERDKKKRPRDLSSDGAKVL